MALLGRGRFSEVVQDAKSASVAIKKIDKDLLQAPHSYKAELKALELLQGSQNILQFLGLDSRAPFDEVWIRMPYYQFTLEQVIFHYAKAKYPPGSGWRNVMPTDTVKRIVGGIARALAAIHEKQIIHRDVKPENVLFASLDGEPTLVDFGVAWVPGVGEEPKVCDVSTGEYKAPELLYGLHNYTNKIDIWSLGCIWARLVGQDCQSLFSPFVSDISLVGAQFDLLGSPSLAECPSLRGSLVENLAVVNPPRPPRVAAEPLALLDYEWTRRPSAEDVLKVFDLELR